MKTGMTWILILTLFLIFFLTSHQAMAKRTERVSVNSAGEEASNHCYDPSISPDGRYVAFSSGANNLVDGDTENNSDIFVHDRATGTTRRVSVVSGTTVGGNDASWSPSTSSDGRYVAFHSFATDLVPWDTEEKTDVFVHDGNTGITNRVSVISGTTVGGNGYSLYPSISADGRYVAFESQATNLVPEDSEGHEDVFVHDRNTGITSRVSVVSGTTTGGNSGSDEASISGDGRYVAFVSSADNLIGPGNDTNGCIDIFVHELNYGTTFRVSVSSEGAEAMGYSENPTISYDGRFVAFESGATNLVADDTNAFEDFFVHDRDTDEDGKYDELDSISTERVSVNDAGTQGSDTSGAGYGGGVSSDGRYVCFTSYATNLVDGDTNNAPDVFVRDRLKGVTKRASVASDGTEGDSSGYCTDSTMSADGRFIAFETDFDNLVPNDNNTSRDIFVRDHFNLSNSATHLLLLKE